MLTRISYLALGFVIGIGCFFTLMSINLDPTTLTKTGRLAPAVEPSDFVMERFAG